MHEVEQILSSHFPSIHWNIEKASGGASKESYIARSSDQRLFVKFAPLTPALSRLAELGISPSVIASGTGERPYIIQEFVEGEHPNIEWFGSHLSELATIINKYQQDQDLKKILGGDSADYDDHVNNELRQLEKDFEELRSASIFTDEVDNLFQMFRVQTEHLQVTPLVPTHADPNHTNFFFTKDGIKIVDWDDVLLSDPARDVGPILWWHVSKEKWPEFFTAYEKVLEDERLYWWVAKCSLSVAFWYLRKNDIVKAKEFLEDFKAAVMKETNPKMV